MENPKTLYNSQGRPISLYGNNCFDCQPEEERRGRGVAYEKRCLPKAAQIMANSHALILGSNVINTHFRPICYNTRYKIPDAIAFQRSNGGLRVNHLFEFRDRLFEDLDLGNKAQGIQYFFEAMGQDQNLWSHFLRMVEFVSLPGYEIFNLPITLPDPSEIILTFYTKFAPEQLHLDLIPTNLILKAMKMV